MSKEKQIEEMARIITSANPLKTTCKGITCIGCEFQGKENCYRAVALYDADYRKQEWISVKDRLPEPNEECLVAVKTKSYLGKDIMVTDLGERVKYGNGFDWVLARECDGEFYCGKYTITHWMPLPQAPKMKGGAE